MLRNEWMTTLMPQVTHVISTRRHTLRLLSVRLWTGGAWSLLAIPMETLWVCFESTSFIWMVLKLLTHLFCPWPNLTSKTNHQISPWFPIPSQKVGCYSTMGMWVQLVRRLVDMMDTVYKSKYCSMGELLVNSLLSTFFEMMETVR